MPHPTEQRACGCIETIYARELSHRTANVLQQAIAAVHFGRRGGGGHLDMAMTQLAGAADLHRLPGDPTPGLVDVSDRLSRACAAMAVASGAGENVSVAVDSDAFISDAHAARPLLMLATELVAISIKHAFPDHRGSISVLLHDDGVRTGLVVEDDGMCAGWWRPGGQGFGIIDALVEAMGGTIRRTITTGGSSRIGIAVPSIAAAAVNPAGTA